MSTTTTTQAPDAASVIAAGPGTGTAPVNEEPGNRGALPMDLEGIEKLFENSPDLSSVQPTEGEIDDPNAEGSTPPPPAVTQPPVPPVVPPEPPVTPPEERILPHRISTSQFDEQTQRAMSVQHELNAGRKPGEPGYMPLKDAISLIEKQDAPPAASNPEVEPAPFAPLETKVTTLQASVADLRSQREELRKDENLYADDIARLDSEIETATDAIIDAKLDLRDAKRQAEQAQAQREAQASEQTRSKRVAAINEAISEYPTAADDTKPLGARVARLTAEMQNPNHPDHALIYAESAGKIIAERAAIDVAKEQSMDGKITFEVALASLRAPAVQPTVQAPGQLPVTKLSPQSGRLTQPETPPSKTMAEAVAEAGDDPDALDAIIRGNRPRVYHL